MSVMKKEVAEKIRQLENEKRNKRIEYLKAMTRHEEIEAEIEELQTNPESWERQ